jgi:tetratricopeptide (TPR) repeat protein
MANSSYCVERLQKGRSILRGLSRSMDQRRVFTARASEVSKRQQVFSWGVMLGLCLLGGCHSKDGLPKPGSQRYGQFVSAFYTGLAALQVGDDVRADSSLAEAARLAPGEPTAWTDWGVLALRQRSYDAAAERLNRAHGLAPDNEQVDYLLGLLESERGNSAAAIAHLQQAVQANPRNLRAIYELASEVERQADAGSDEHFQQLMEQILAIEPNNLAAQLDLARIAAKRGDVQTLKASIARISDQSRGWSPEITQQLDQLQAAANGPQPRSAATKSIFLRNVLMRLPGFREDLSQLKPAPGEGAQPITHLLRVVSLPSLPAPADSAITFTAETKGVRDDRVWTWAGSINLNGNDAPDVAQANASEVLLGSGARLAFPGGGHSPTAEGVVAADFNYDFKMDLVLAGAGGVRFFRQENPAHFTDVTSQTKLPQSVIDGKYTGGWALDIEADGDLDILLGTASGNPIVLRNNGDGTFAVTHPFAGIDGVRQLVWIDLNGDGNPDAAMIDGAGHLHLYLNQRSGNFVESAQSGATGQVKAIAVADADSSGILYLIAVEANGSVVRVSSSGDGGSWSSAEIARVPDPNVHLAAEVRLHAADLDNNGAVDLLLAPVELVEGKVGTAIIWLQDEHGAFEPLPQTIQPGRVFDVADLNGNGRLSLIGLTDAGALSVATNHGTKNYHWQTIRPRARQSTGDQRINSFGIGGEIEIRAGLLVQKQPIERPELHFGLGDQTQVEVARILWPNGSMRAEFALNADQQIVTEQRLKGSCPFLFAWDGKSMSFVKDSVPWGSAIGLRINALGAPDIAATEEWYKIGRDQLQARDGFYDLRITGELWETYYYDSMALMTVDHPAGTEIFTDERFDVPPVKLAVTAVGEPQPIVRAIDDNGRDVTATLSKLDGIYLDNFGRGQYQGVTRDHYVEIELPASMPTNGPLWLIAKGWLHPSDSSVNVALGQGGGEKPRWLSLEVPDGKGGWRVAKPNLGFPAGRNKICLIDLSDVFGAGVPHRLRLRTNLEVFWDSIEWATGEPGTPMKIQRLSAESADLHYRGFSVISQANSSSPELPDYNHLSGTSQRWRDLEGFYTRFGDVRELLAKTDDRYVIMNAGDEMSLRFSVPTAPPPGWVRDFVIAGDGWIKDGDYNSMYSQTVLPYPHHARREYNTAPGRLEDDWVYQHHRNDWLTYQTRYVTAGEFQNALRTTTPARANRYVRNELGR